MFTDNGVAGWVYLLCFTDPETGEHATFGHAGHYMGWALNVPGRLSHHGTAGGARLLFHVKQAGLSWEVSRVWAGSKRLERRLKEQGGHSRKCPRCGVKPVGDWEQVMANALTA